MNISLNKLLIYLKSVKIILTVIALTFFIFTASAYSYWDKITNIPPQYTNNTGWLEFWFLKSDPNYGWLCGFEGKVIRTTDRGKTWQGTIVPGADQLESICFPDKLIGYVSGMSIYGYGAIYKSVDGGATWREITDPRRRTLLWGNYFLDKNNGIVVGGSCGYYQQFFRTKDGGKTWSLFEDNTFSNTSLSDVELHADGTGVAVSSGHLWRTSDGGYTWQEFNITGREDWQEDLHISGSTILVPYSIGCDGNLRDGGIRITPDYGNTWREFSTGNSMFGAWLMDSRRGWACGHSAALYYTSDTGINWELRNCGIDENDVLDDFWFIDDTTGFVCGKSVYRYSPPKNIQTKIISSNMIACEGDTITLAANGSYFHYEWSNGSADSLIKITKSGNYELVVYNTLCDTLNPDSIKVTFSPKPEITIDITQSPVICEGDSIILHARTNASKLQWSTGETTDSIVVKTEGTYSVTATNEFGCTNNTEIFIRVSPTPAPGLTLNGRNKFCTGDSTEIIATPGYKYYHWSDGSILWTTITNSIKVGVSGQYVCIAENDDGCTGGGKDTIQITVISDTNRIAFIFPPNEEILLDSVYFPDLNCKYVRLFNPTSKDWTINLPYLIQNKSFSFPLNQFPILLKAGDTVDLKVCYSPSRLGLERDTVIMEDVCNPHYLYFKGLSLAKIYQSSSVCDAPVTAKTIELPGKYKFSTTVPSPNPSAGIVEIGWSKISDNNDFAEKAVLVDLYGNNIQTAEYILDTEIKSEGYHVVQGNFVFNVSNVESGYYFIVIKTRNGIINYKQMIIH